MGPQNMFVSYPAAVTVGAYLIVVASGATGCQPAAGAAVPLLGVGDNLSHPPGDRVDVSIAPIGEVRLGGVVARGEWLTSAADGRAVATAAAGAHVIGYADQAGVADDVIRFLRAPGRL